jgi:hypothetical protein
MRHLFASHADQAVNQSLAGAFLCARMMGWDHNGTAASGQKFHGRAIQDSLDWGEC